MHGQWNIIFCQPGGFLFQVVLFQTIQLHRYYWWYLVRDYNTNLQYKSAHKNLTSGNLWTMRKQGIGHSFTLLYNLVSHLMDVNLISHFTEFLNLFPNLHISPVQSVEGFLVHSKCNSINQS